MSLKRYEKGNAWVVSYLDQVCFPLKKFVYEFICDVQWDEFANFSQSCEIVHGILEPYKMKNEVVVEEWKTLLNDQLFIDDEKIFHKIKFIMIGITLRAFD